jgi:serine/threonine protein kinase
VGLLDSLKSLFGGGDRVDVKKRFDLLGRTGQGSMSKVWRARDKKIGRVVCLKLLDKAKTAKFEARFQGAKKPKEGVICAMLKHPNIVQTYEQGVTTQGEPFLVMELIDGYGLNFLVETKAASLKGNRIKILTQMAEAIGYLHELGFVHRDICPRNVMVTKDGDAKLIDFGLTIPNKPEFQKPGNRTGTPDYLAPEVIRRVTTDHRVDLFALGVTAFEMFTHHLPWDKQPDSMMTLQNHMNSLPHNPHEFVPTLDKKTHAFLMKAVDREPRDRYQTAADFVAALRSLPNQ